MKRFSLRDFAPILLMLGCAIIFGVLLFSGVIDLETVPTLVDHRPILALLVIMVLYLIKGFSGVILHNALIVVVSLIYNLPAALLINGVGTALCLSVSYCIGRKTKTDSIAQWMEGHPKLKKYCSTTQQYGFVSCFAIHMLGLNMEVLGIFFGMLRLNFWSYLVSSWLAVLPGMVCITILGANLDFHSPVFWIVLAADLLLMGFGLLYTKKTMDKGQAKENAANEDKSA